ncbi:hypothetical protein NDR87_33090 [Nocardia sp. CDC159]|uniref:Lipoprotein n=1 Tax=Nocardia pulmonis TaxID=2951408 RepID=A0A9X2EDL5_9NOCA|nr:MULTISPECIES: hypothetical protein [Nocardia]MCM6778385.1 hypothetical protein [Nocardia pulmonis]MCM6791219.1 hypothetical protein [Nocardia sp. CDC159]
MRTVPWVMAAVLLLAPAFGAACATEPEVGSGSPTTSVGLPSSSVAPPPTLPPAISAPPPAPSTGEERAVAVLGPLGYQGINLGMTDIQARGHTVISAVEPADDPGACRAFSARAGWGGYFNERKVVSIHTMNPRTPEGIYVGSTLTQVRAAYPDLRLGVDWSSAAVPGHPAHRYGFKGINASSGPDAKVTELLLFFADRNICHN